MGPQAYARSGEDQAGVRERKAPQGRAHRGLPARDCGDGQPDHHPRGRRGGGGGHRLQSPLHSGRGGGSPGGPRPVRLRLPGRERERVLRLHQESPGAQAQCQPGRRRRHHRHHPQGASGACRPDVRRLRGDDHRSRAPAGHGRGQGASLSSHCRQRCRDQDDVRQPLRHGPEHTARHHAGHQLPLRRQDRGRGRLRLVRPGIRHAGQGPRVQMSS